MTLGSLFSGIGGLDLGLERAGFECRWQVERDEYCQRVLAKHWPNVRRYGDIDGVTELESVDLVAGGFPCQSVSLAGRRKAQEDERWLWPEFLRIVRMVRPRYVLVENTPGMRSAGAERIDGEWRDAPGLAMGEVLGGLAESGFDAEWTSVPACALGAHHIRERLFIVAYAAGQRCGAGRPWGSDPIRARESEQPLPDAYADSTGQQAGRTGRDRRDGAMAERRDRRQRVSSPPHKGIFADLDIAGLALRQEQVVLEQLETAQRSTPADPDGEPLVRAAIARGERHAWSAEPGVVRMVHGVPNRVERIGGLGNAVVPQVAELIGLAISRAEARAC